MRCAQQPWTDRQLLSQYYLFSGYEFGNPRSSITESERRNATVTGLDTLLDTKTLFTAAALSDKSGLASDLSRQCLDLDTRHYTAVWAQALVWD